MRLSERPGFEKPPRTLDEAKLQIDSLRLQLAEARAHTIEGVWEQARQNHVNYSTTDSDEDDIRFLTLGLVGEAGEAANFVKKRWRDGEPHEDAIRKEIADVCAYAFMLADKMGMTPASLIATIAEKQEVFIAKMQRRALSPPHTDKGEK